MEEKTKQDYFAALHKDRSNSAETFEKPSNRELWRSVVDKYSDQAHFIYELIQNADDAGATTARFILEPERLIFAHNGTRHFSISNLDDEAIDSQNGCLGDINAITGIAFSNKKTQENKIGKFGVGFKAVFQYTSTPHIYDPEFRFRIDRYIVPSQLAEDFPGRRPEETLFVFPFDQKDRNPQESYRDIEGKLKALSYPILFLSNLLDISFEIGKTIGSYGKKPMVKACTYADDTTAEKICLMQNCGDDSIKKYLWLFSRCDNGLKYSVGFFIDENNHLIPVNEPAFCFFPTKETTGLNFIVHAPFLLTDSREGIRVGIEHNNKLIELLAKLAGASLIYLRNIGEDISVKMINDNIFSIIPIDEDDFCDLDDTSKISFLPFYTEIKHIFKTEEIIPTRDGFTISKNAYWAAVPYLSELFSDSQLTDICVSEIPLVDIHGNNHAKWAFVSLGGEEVKRTNPKLFSYINAITYTGLTEQHLICGRYSRWIKKKDIKGITASFIEKQPLEWLFTLYKWLSETSLRTKLAKTAPIFLDQNSKAASAFRENSDHLLLFLPSDDMQNYRTVREDLLKNKDAVELIQKVGITHPSIRDEIFNVIIPQYKSDGSIDTNPHFKLFFQYYCQCPRTEIDGFIHEIRDCKFIRHNTQSNSQIYRGKAADLYMPTKELRIYFETKPTTAFVAYDEYLSLVGASNEKQLNEFLIALGVKRCPSVLLRTVPQDEQSIRDDLPKPYSRWSIQYEEHYIDGSEELINSIIETHSLEKSIIFWNQLLAIIRINDIGLSSLLGGTCKYFYYQDKRKNFTSANAKWIKTKAWLANSDGKFVCPNQLTLQTMAANYPKADRAAKELLEFLGIDDEERIKMRENSNLTESQRKKVELADYIIQQGLTKEDLEKLVTLKKAREERIADTHNCDLIVDDASSDNLESDEKSELLSCQKTLNQMTSRVTNDILRRTKSVPTTHEDKAITEYEDVDADEYIPSPVDFSRKAELEKEKAARIIDRIVHQEELQERALAAEKYTYGWFRSLLELEELNSNANNLNSKEISISFTRVEREPGTQRTLILMQPNRYIPQFMEDLADIPLVIQFGEQTKTLAIEVVNVKSYTLRVKLKSHEDIKDLDFSQVTEARIDAKSPVFLLEELRKAFDQLNYQDSYNMQQNLCQNIEFVFGPPGTGKTTYLAKNILIPLMQQRDNLKVLVLTPTNKSADVLVRRIMDLMQDDDSYNDWLVRFGGTGDEVIEQSRVYREKTFDIRAQEKNVTVTTIARFPYDFFMPQGTRIFLNGIHWDYIVIDEASMIPLIGIIYPLYKKTPRKFIIAGDPFQIEPITSVNLWKNENIYTMVELDSFDEPHTIPHDYKVELLTTQYRSVPSIGAIFSQFAYGGMLSHYRQETDRKLLNLDEEYGIEVLNIIKFPVSKYESIYHPKRLQHSSSYQVYSALFTFEYAIYLAKAISKANPDEFFRIGIIAPYRAQADLIERLISSEYIPAKVDIQVGTIHGFQGDECDIIFAVFNTPPAINAGKDMFLNKCNIINVSISRAKDYLFIIMPDDNTENIYNLRLVKRVEQLIKSSGSYREICTSEVEQQIFGSSTYLEDNSFSTGHQSVNVYSLPEKRYEIRSEDTAVDIQVHRLAKSMSSVDSDFVFPV